MAKAIVLINDTTYAYNLRGALLEALVREKHEVVVVGESLRHAEALEQLGCRLIHVETNRHRVNPWHELKLLCQYCRILKDERPDVVLTFNIKPNVYGGFACRLLRIPYITNITGLGTPLGKAGPLQRVTLLLYKHGIAGASCVFFQNESNRRFFLDHGLLKGQRNQLLPGSGVDLGRYPALPYPTGGELHFLFAARIMKEKGIDLFLEAARAFADEKTIFDVCGPCEDADYLRRMEANACIRYHGEQDDMRPFYRQCSCFILPGWYPEGMSNVLLEAAASGRPAITTDNPGCRETVENGISGYIVPAQDCEALLKAVKRFLSLPTEAREAMGRAARGIAETRFDRRIVVKAYMKAIHQICDRGNDAPDRTKH